jgi:hypothetical protein
MPMHSDAAGAIPVGGEENQVGICGVDLKSVGAAAFGMDDRQGSTVKRQVPNFRALASEGATALAPNDDRTA